MPTYLIDTHGNSRLAQEDWSNQTGDNGSYTNWLTTDLFILCIQVGYDIMVACNKAPNAAQLKLQWQRDALGWNDVTGSSEIAWAADASGITDDGTGTLRIGTGPAGCSGAGTARENENDNTLPDAGTISIVAEDWVEAQWALDPANAVAGGVYSFQVVNVTSGDNVLANSIASTVTIASETTTTTSTTTTSSTTASSTTTSTTTHSTTTSSTTVSTTTSTHTTTTSSTTASSTTTSTTTHSTTTSSTTSTSSTTTTTVYYPLTEDEFNDQSIAAFWNQDTDSGGTLNESAGGTLDIYAGLGTVWTTAFQPAGVYQGVGSSEDFDVWIKVTVPTLTGNYQHAGLMFAVDTDNFVKIARYYWSGEQIVFAHVVSGVGYQTIQANSDTTVWLRLKRVGSTFTAFYATSEPTYDTDWTEISAPATELSSSAAGNLWVHANTQGEAQFTANFDYFKFWTSATTTTSSTTTSSTTTTTTASSTSTSSTISTTSTFSTTTTTEPYGTVCWGQITSVVEVYIRGFSGQWTGDGSISGSGDSEIITLSTGQYMETVTPWYFGPGSCRITLNKYQNGDSVTIKYKNGSTSAACIADTWHDYSGSFMSSGFILIRLEG